MASLARGSETSIHSVDRSSQPGISEVRQETQPQAGKMGFILHPFDFFRDISPRHTDTKADALSRLHESSIVPHTHESIISPTIILAPSNGTSWQRSPKLRLRPSTGRDTTQSHVCTICSASEEHSMGTLYPQFGSSRHRCHCSVTHQSLLVVHIGRPILSSTFGDAPPVMYPSPLTNYLLASYNLYPIHTTPLVSHSHWLYHGFTTIRGSYHHPHSGWSFLQDMSLYTSAQTTHCPRDSRGLMQLRVPILWPPPEDIVSDRGPQFTSRVWSAFCQKLNINVSLTSGYHPQSNGQVERLNQELTRFLRSYCHRNQADWSRFLLWAEYAQNSLCKPATGLTPFKCVLGFQPSLIFHGPENPQSYLR